MSYGIAKQRREVAEPERPISYRCPANGCPNAASVSFDGSRWACYFHAKAESEDWPATTQWIGENWPRACNWNHPDKVAYEAEQAAKRRAKLKQNGSSIGGFGLLP
jgi:hypothetical protein